MRKRYIINQIREELEICIGATFNFYCIAYLRFRKNYFPVIEKLNKEQQNISKLLRKKPQRIIVPVSDLEIEGCI